MQLPYSSLHQWLVESLNSEAQLLFPPQATLRNEYRREDERNLAAESERGRETQADTQQVGWRETESIKSIGRHPNGSLPSAPQMWCGGEGETGGLEMEGRCCGAAVNHGHLCTGVDSRSRLQGAVPWCPLGQINKLLLLLQRGAWLDVIRNALSTSETVAAVLQDLIYFWCRLNIWTCSSICFLLNLVVNVSLSWTDYDAPFLHLWAPELELFDANNSNMPHL